MALFETVLVSDLKKPVQVKQLSGNLFSADNGGNKITVEVLDGGNAASLSGTVTGYIIRADDATVTVTGTLSSNKASIVLPASAYTVVGQVSIVIKLGTTTLGACTAHVYRTTTDVIVDPGHVIPSIGELLAKIGDCETATANANKVANLTVSAEAATGSSPDAVLSETGSGSSAHKHITFKLVKGETGNTGATPVISIGTVTTLDPDQDATASMDTTDPAHPVLSLGIPQGVDGDTTIDDDAGIGDTTDTWSADKLEKEFNQKADLIEVTDSTAEAVKTFTDGADNLPMELLIGIEPVQDLHGQEYPYPGGAGKNLLNPEEAEEGFVTSTGAIQSGLNGLHSDFIPVTVGDTYYFTGHSVSRSDATTRRLHFYDSNKSWLRNEDSVSIAKNTSIDYSLHATAQSGDAFVVVSYADADTNVMVEDNTSATPYAPYSNICLISGWTGANVTRTGKNLFNKNIGTNAGIRDANGNPSSSSTSKHTDPIRVKPNTTYTLSGTIVNSSTNSRVYFLKKDKSWISRTGTKASADYPYTFTTGAECYYIQLQYPVAPADFNTIQLEEGSVATTYEAFGSSYPVSWETEAGTVYGGTLTINKDGSGLLTVDRATMTLGAAEEIRDSAVTGTGKYVRYAALGASFDADTINVIGEKIRGIKQNDTFYREAWMANTFRANNVLYVAVFVPYDSTISSVDAVLQGSQIVYRLESPIEYELTATQVKTLLGVNNLYADCGDILSVTYPADTKLYVDNQIADKISASQRLMELIVTANREDGMKATKAYSEGDMLIVSGTLYKASTSIANGATLTVDTNITATTVAAEIAALA